MNDLKELEKVLDIKFKNPDLLTEAITHRSFLNENPKEKVSHNERFEFLGDAVLELIVTEFLFNNYPEKNEGELTALRAALVNSNMLSEISSKLKLGKFLRVSKGEAKGSGKGKQFISADAVEALIGAIYLDQGYDKATEFIEKHVCSNIGVVLENKLWRDAKSLFQEKAQEIEGITPTYSVLSETGPDHQKHFIIGVCLEEELIAKGEGYSKQEAQQQAAENALNKKGWQD
jgi:ribonuclease-3